MSDEKFALLQRAFSSYITSPKNKYTLFHFVQNLLEDSMIET